MKDQSKLTLKGFSEESGLPFKREIHTLDEVKSCGNYVVICKNASIDNGLPQINGKMHSCFCCEAQLSVTCCYSEDGAQSSSAYGQTLTICDRKTGDTNTYIRTISPDKNNGRWSIWRLTTTNNNEVTFVSNSMIDNDFIGVSPIECHPIDTLYGYYTTDNKFNESSLIITRIYELSINVLYNLTTYSIGIEPTANFVMLDDELQPITAFRENFVNLSIRRSSTKFIGITTSSENINSSFLQAYSTYYLRNERILPGCITSKNIKPNSIEPESTKFFSSKNLFNKNDENVIFGGYDIGEGFQESPTLNLSGYIPVNVGNTYVFSAKNSNNALARFVTYYNNAFEPLSYEIGKTIIVIPENTSFVRITIAKDWWNYFQMENGTLPTEYQEYSPKFNSNLLPYDLENGIETTTEPVGLNLCDPSKITTGSCYIDTTSGEAITDTSLSNICGGYTDYIPITESSLASTGCFYGGDSIGYAVYDKNKKYIRGAKANIVVYKEGDAFVRFTIRKDSEVMVCKGIIPMDYEPYEGVRIVAALPHDATQEVKISLPDKIYAVVGDTLQLFYRGIVQTVNPYNYNILISCSKGAQYPRYFEYTPTASDIGTVDFKIQVTNSNRNVIVAGFCKLITVNSAKLPSHELKVMCFGDSLTGAGIWCREVDRRLTESGGTPIGNGFNNISFVGSKSNSNTGYFGIGGWSWNSYTSSGSPAYRFHVTSVSSLSVGSTYTNNGNTFTIIEVNITEGNGDILCSVNSLSPAPELTGILTKSSGNGDNTVQFSSYSQDSQNPLWDYTNNKMTFIPYANRYSEGRIDVVYTLLSWNRQTPWKTDFSDVIEQIKIFADTLHSEFPDAKFKIMGLQVPSINGGIGSSYGATGDSYADGYGMVVTALNMNKAYQDFANNKNYSEFVEFVNVSSQFDSEYCMPYAETPVNTRCAVTEIRGTNGVHPNSEGYMQIADVVYRNFVANFCQ